MENKNTPAVVTAPAAEAAPAVVTAPAAEAAPAVVTAPAAEAAPAVVTAPAAEAAPAVVTAPAAEAAPAVVAPATVSPEKAERERRNIAKLKALADLAQTYKNKYASFLLARKVERNKADRYTAVDATIEWVDKDGKTKTAPISFSVLSLMKKAEVPVEEIKAALTEFRRCASIFSDYKASDSDKKAAFASAIVNADFIMLKVAGLPPKSLKSKQVESLLASAYDIAKNGGSDARKESEVMTKFEIMARMKLKGMEASNAFEERIRLKKSREENASTDSINAAANGTTTEAEMVKREAEQANQESAA